MKTKFTLLVLFVAAAFAASAQQIPNLSFDSWTTSQLAPDGWSSYDAAFGFNLNHCNKDTVDYVVGTASVKLTSDSFSVAPQYGVVPGLLSLGTGVANPNPTFTGMAFAYKPDTLFIGYKYTSPGTDTATLAITMKKNGVGVFTGNASTIGLYLDTLSQWALLYTTITSFYGANTPDTLGLKFFSSNRKPIKGSTLHLDGVFFGYVNLPSALQEVADQLNVSVYPNPASDLITISTDVNTVGYRAIITDMNGKLVSANNLEGQKTTINVSEFPSGTYIYRIADAQGNILKQNRFNVVK